MGGRRITIPPPVSRRDLLRALGVTSAVAATGRGALVDLALKIFGYDGPHTFPAQAQQRMGAWFDRWV